jgi:hypothetical protein
MKHPESLIGDSIELVHNFAASDLGKNIPEGADFVLIPDDNPNLAEANRNAAQNYRKRGGEVLFISASRANPDGEYTVFTTIQDQESGKIPVI